MKSENSELLSTISLLDDWIISQDYKGWDPYDIFDSKLLSKFEIKNFYFTLLLAQFNKFSPINFRPILKIDKGIDLKGIALLAQAYSRLYRVNHNDRFKMELIRSISFIEENSLKIKGKYESHCWASHYFPYIGADKSKLSPDTFDLIGTCQAIIALIEGYLILKDERLKEMAISASNFLIDQLFIEKNGNSFFIYSPTDEDKIIFNASAQALEALCQLMQIHTDKNIRTICESAANFLIEQQLTNGSWVYSINKVGEKRVQLDFHQGYIIDGLMAFLPYASPNIEGKLIDCIKKGASFYKDKLFFKEGYSYYRYPMRYPVDIHNQAQGIISFSKLCSLEKNYLKFAETIARWTVLNMQDSQGFFYYQKHMLFSNKIPHMRWGQAWMMLALATLLEKSIGATE